MRINGEHLFVYGTLLLPEIMQRVTGQRYFYQPADLHDYARYQVRGKRYPAIIHQPGELVQGILYINVSPVAWQRLDDYEDHFYVRELVEVQTVSGESARAWAYVIPPSQQQRLSPRDWSLSQFRQRHLREFLQHLESGCRG
jgi:gamma-glutamylcyclotransferase (GGCT)/AIG2-like uncharacterized protein YtfP